MKILGKIITFHDFVPPVLYRLARYFGIKVNYGKREEPYIAPCLNSYAQYHEDLILQSIFAYLKGGFYVDVGANHPSILSNTKKFYNQGWQGINIEPNPLLIENFEKERTRDINLNIGISDKCSEMDFYRMSADTLSTFSKESALDAEKLYKESIVDIIRVEVNTLAWVFENHSATKEIDFMSVDVEGYDLLVLKSNNWKLYRPKVLMIEVNQDEEQITKFIESRGYKIGYKNHTNAIFIDDAFAKSMLTIDVE